MEDSRKYPRCPIRWRSAIVIAQNGGQETIQGMTNDISIAGVSVICHRNISLGHAVNVYLLIHPGDENNPQLIVEAQGKVMNNVLSGQQGGFRLGIQFIKFAGDSKKILQKYIPKDSGYGVTPVANVAPVAKRAPAEDAAPIEGVTPAEGVAPAEDVALAKEVAPEDVAPTADVTPAEDLTPAARPPQ